MSGPDADWRPTADWRTLARRAAMLAEARDWFRVEGVTEVETPALGLFGVTDVNIESISARLARTPRREWYLHSSPEYCMKRLLAAGAPDIYQICHVYRDSECGAAHQPEFTMVEWYRHGFGLEEMVDDTIDFVATVLRPDRGTLTVQLTRYRDVFLAATGVDPLAADEAEITDAARAAGGGEAVGERDAALDFLMATRVVPTLAEDSFTAITHYPADQASLAALDPDDPALALRFELFLDGREIANGFEELRDEAEQRERFAVDRARRRRLGRPDRRVDERLLAALAAGLPPLSGVAVGFDRLVMSALGVNEIRRVQSFAVLD